MSPELEKKLYLDGIHLFNDHEFFEAHEVWEDIWHMAYGLKHDFYQGMIQGRGTGAPVFFRAHRPQKVKNMEVSRPAAAAPVAITNAASTLSKSAASHDLPPVTSPPTPR